MSLRLSWLACCALLLWPAQSALAADAVRLVGVEGRVGPAPQLPAVFGNREQKLDLEIDGPAIESGSLLADFYLFAGYAMPLARNIKVKDGLALPSASPKQVQVSLKFPDVKRPSQIILSLRLFPKPGTSPIGSSLLKFEVFPASLTKDLTDLLQPKPDGAAQVVVFGPGQKLRRFLTGQHVPFEDGGDGTPDRFDPNRLYFGEPATDEQFQQARDRSAGARLALFSSDESLPTGVYADRSNSGVFIQVTLPLLDNLADDPRAQLGLMKIVRLLSAPPSSPSQAPNL